MRFLTGKVMSILIVFMLVAVIFVQVPVNVGAKSKGQEGKNQDDADEPMASISSQIQTQPVQYSPEAVIYFDISTYELKVEGIDETGDEVDIQQRTVLKSKHKEIILFILTDIAGNTMELTMEFNYNEKKPQMFEVGILKISYGSGDVVVYNNKGAVYKADYKIDKKAGKLTDLKLDVAVEDKFKAGAHYDPRKDETTLVYNEKGLERIANEIGGLGILKLRTDAGELKLSISSRGMEESIETWKSGKSLVEPTQLRSYNKLLSDSEAPVNVRFGDFTGVPEFVRGRWPLTDRSLNSIEAARSFLETYRDLFRFDKNTDSLKLIEMWSGRVLNQINVKFQQEYTGIPIFGSEIIVHLNRNSDVLSVNGNFIADIAIGTKERLTESEALRIAELDLPSMDSRITTDTVSKGELMVYNTYIFDRFNEGKNYLAWHFQIKTSNPTGSWYYIVDAERGTILDAWNNLQRGSEGLPWNELLYLRQPGAIAEAYEYIFGNSASTTTGFVNPIWSGELDHIDNFINFDGRCTPANDNGGVTANSAIMTKLFFLIAYGGAHYGIFSEGIGVTKTKTLLLTALTDSGMSKSGSFMEFRDVVDTTCSAMVGGFSGISKSDYKSLMGSFKALGYWILKQSVTADVAENYDMFGRVLAKGDFNNDSYEDLAVGVPHGDNEEINDGKVFVFYGSFTGLETSNPEVLTQTLADAGNSAFDHFGKALASGDFNGDSFDDLAVGVPEKSWGSKTEAGQVIVFYGSSDGLVPDPAVQGNKYILEPPTVERLKQSHAGALNENDDQFGFALAAGDFDNDSFDDLAVGVPYENYNEKDDGIVIVFYGYEEGLLPDGPFISPVSNSEYFSQVSAGQENEEEDSFGYALAAGDFDGDSFDDLAVGVPSKDRSGKTDTGIVLVFYGSNSGLKLGYDYELLDQPLANAENEDYDFFGKSLASGDFNNDSFDDLVVGAPFKNYKRPDSGLIFIFLGVEVDGILPDGIFVIPLDNAEYLKQEDAYANSENGDFFGHSLSMADFDGDGFDDIAVGMPYEEYDSKPGAGAVMVFYGTDEPEVARTNKYRAYYLKPGYFGCTEKLDHNFGFALVGGDFNGDGKSELAVSAPNKQVDGIKYAGAVFVRTLEPALPWVNTNYAIVYSRDAKCAIGIKNPDEKRAMASTTKMMTAILLIERTLLDPLDPNYLDLDTNVTISVKAASIGGSNMYGDPWVYDTMNLRDLLWGLLLPSGNDAAVAIAEKISGYGGGDNGGVFSLLMNIRAAQLGLTNTHFMNPHGRDFTGHYSTARDLARLGDFAMTYPLFARIVNTTSQMTSSWEDLFGFNRNTMQYITNKLLKSSSSYYYPEANGIKTGTTDNAGQCLVSSASSGGKNVIGVVLHSTTYYGGPPDRYTDSTILLDYGLETDYP
jgi:D-alanyl-D-alanine carboxypeptidase